MQARTINTTASSSPFAVKPKTEILFRRQWPKSTLAFDIAGMDAETLAVAYEALRASAPRRRAQSRYFVGHAGLTSGRGASNRREEHIAVALVALRRRWPLPDGGAFELLDYQVPLKSKRTDAGIGKIDLIGVTDAGRIVVVELKVKAQSGGDSDPPPTALIEGLRYSAIVEANLDRFREEIARQFGRVVSSQPPIVLVLGEAAWSKHGPPQHRLDQPIWNTSGVSYSSAWAS